MEDLFIEKETQTIANQKKQDAFGQKQYVTQTKHTNEFRIFKRRKLRSRLRSNRITT